MFFRFPPDARWNTEMSVVEFGIGVGEYEGVVRIPRRIFQRPGCAVVGRTLPGLILPGGANWRMVGAAVFGTQVAGSITLIWAGGSSMPPLIFGCVLLGLGVGNVGSLSPLIVQAEFAQADVPRVIALVVATNQVVFAFGPAVLGVLRDATSMSWAPVLACGLIQLAAGLVVLAGLTGKPRNE